MSEPVDSKTGQPIGSTVDARPAQRLGPVTLEGRYGRVEKLEAKHAASLWVAVKGDDRLWTYMAYGPFTDASSFASWVSERAGLTDPYSYVVVAPCLLYTSPSPRDRTRSR